MRNIPELKLKEVQEPKKIRRAEANNTFHRAPRNVPLIYKEIIKIEQPPEPHFSKKKSLFMQIAPPFTMAIPMLLGCSLAMYSMRLNGSSSSVFMYTGLFTAVGSAVFGSIWAVLNVRNEKKEETESEDERVNSYSSYLIKISESLREKYAHNRDAMLKMYPSAQEVCLYNRNSTELWSRNRSHEDFLFYRLGLGSIPFQVKVSVPEKKFSLNSDFLRDKPELLYDDYQKLEQVPVGIDLKQDKLLGIVGAENSSEAVSVMQSIAVQIAANNCYTDVKMVFVYDENSAADKKQWEMMKWFPHVWNENKKNTLCCIKYK